MSTESGATGDKPTTEGREQPENDRKHVRMGWAAIFLLSLLVAGAGVGHSLFQKHAQLTQQKSFPCPPLTDVSINEKLVINSRAKPTSYTLIETVAFPIAGSRLKSAAQLKKLALMLTDGTSRTAHINAHQCLFTAPSSSIVTLKSISKNIVTFQASTSISGNSLASGVSGWTAHVDPQITILNFTPHDYCLGGVESGISLLDWTGSNLSVTVSSDNAPIHLSSLPDFVSGKSYSWYGNDVTCDNPFRLSLTVPTNLASYLTTRVNRLTTTVSPTLVSLVGSFGFAAYVIIGVGLTFRNRRILTDQQFTLSLSLLALICAVTAVIYIDAVHYPLWSQTVVILMFGLAAVLVIRLGHVRRKNALIRRITLATLSIPAAVLAIGSTAWSTSIDLNSAHESILMLILDALALSLVLTIGVVSYTTIRAIPITDTAGRSWFNIGSWRNWVTFWAGGAITIALAYSLGNLGGSGISPGNLGFTEFETLRFLPVGYADLLIIIALAIPLLFRGPTAEKNIITAAVFSWSISMQPPEVGFAGTVMLPVSEIVLTVLLCLLIDRSTHKYLLPSSSNLRASMPRPWPEALVLSLKISAVLAILPTGYFTYTALNSSSAILDQPGADVFFVIAGIISQFGGWVITGAIFAALSPRLRGINGPVRALLVSAAWSATALLAYIADSWEQTSSSQAWIFSGIQLLLFLVAFGITWDFFILRKDTFWDTIGELRSAYKLQQTRTVILYAIPLILAIVTLGQQLAAGNGAEFVKSVLDTIPAVFGR